MASRSLEEERKAHRRKLYKGILCIMIAWLAFTIMATIVRLDSPAVPVTMILFVQNVISLLLTLPFFFRFGFHELKTKRFSLIAFRGLSGLLGFTFFFLAVQKTSITNTILMNNTTPILLPFIAWVWLRVKIDHRLWPGIILGFIGIALILKPGKELFNPGIFYALASALTLGAGMIAMRLLSYTERNHTVLFYFFLIGSVVISPLAIMHWQPLSLGIWVSILIVGVFSFVGQMFFLRALHYGKASHIAPFGYTAIIFAALIDWYLFGHVPDLLSVLGIILVCCGGICAIVFSRPPPLQKPSSGKKA